MMRAYWLAALLALAPGLAHAQAEKPFLAAGPTVNVAATAASANVQFQPSASSPNVRVYNGGTAPVFVACGGSAVATSVSTGMPVAPGVAAVFACAQQYMAVITATPGTVYFTPGSGR
jgi:hypothetical protein